MATESLPAVANPEPLQRSRAPQLGAMYGTLRYLPRLFEGRRRERLQGISICAFEAGRFLT